MYISLGVGYDLELTRFALTVFKNEEHGVLRVLATWSPTMAVPTPCPACCLLSRMGHGWGLVPACQNVAFRGQGGERDAEYRSASRVPRGFMGNAL
jgi:hypothetical protein